MDMTIRAEVHRDVTDAENVRRTHELLNLAGTWEDSVSGDDIVAGIRSARCSKARDVEIDFYHSGQSS